MIEIDASEMKQHTGVQIFVDFDGTLAHYDSWDKQGNELGRPILPMLNKVKEWLAKDYGVTIFTARLSHNEEESHKQTRLIHEFLRQYNLPELPVTAIKSHRATHFVDDRAYHVIKNKGILQEEDMGI